MSTAISPLPVADDRCYAHLKMTSTQHQSYWLRADQKPRYLLCKLIFNHHHHPPIPATETAGKQVAVRPLLHFTVMEQQFRRGIYRPNAQRLSLSLAPLVVQRSLLFRVQTDLTRKANYGEVGSTPFAPPSSHLYRPLT